MKLKSHILILSVLIVLMSCYNIEKPQKPDDLLTEDEMVTILIDMAMMSSAKGVNKKKIEDNGIIPDAYIFEKHNIDSTRFNNSNNYYAYNIETYDDIYKKVKDSLTKLREHYKSIEVEEKKEKAKQDSIKKIERVKQDSIYKLKGGKSKTLVKQLKKSLQ